MEQFLLHVKGNTLVFFNLITCGFLPVNVLLNEEGDLKVISDFSICKENNIKLDMRIQDFFFLYENLVNKTFCKQCFQAVLKNEFNVDSKEWKYIYRCKLLDMSSSLVKILLILTRSF